MPKNVSWTKADQALYEKICQYLQIQADKNDLRRLPEVDGKSQGFGLVVSGNLGIDYNDEFRTKLKTAGLYPHFTKGGVDYNVIAFNDEKEISESQSQFGKATVLNPQVVAVRTKIVADYTASGSTE